MGTGFTDHQKQIVLDRDGHKCPICGQHATTVNHRANRGAGGHKAGNRLSNSCAICPTCNGLIESDPTLAELARTCGVKLSRYDDPMTAPYRHPVYDCPVWLDDSGGFAFHPPDE